MIALPLAHLLLSITFGSPSDSVKSVKGQLAVLSIENTTGSYQSFVDGMPDMIVTELVNQTDEVLVERTKVVQAMNELKLQATGLALEGNRKLGQWIGAEKVLLGSLNRFGAGIRLDLRLIDVGTGQILAASSSQSVMGNQPNELLKDALDHLILHLRRKPSPIALEAPPVPVLTRKVVDVPPRMEGAGVKKTDSGSLKIKYRTTLSLLTEQTVPFQVVRIYVDGKWAADSPLINAIDQDFLLFEGKLPEGNHELRMEHWIADAKGKRGKLLSSQPQANAIFLGANQTVAFDYRMKVQVVGFAFQDPRVQ